jgi:endonuclease/exonuclease/phosphatase (EEP) superfamily protein YafD
MASLNLFDNNDDYDVLSISTLTKDYSRYVTDQDLPNLFKNETKPCIDVIHINARSLKKNFNELENLLARIPNKLTAIAITETWLNESNQTVFSLPGYNFVSKCRTSKTGGGVGIFLSTDYSFTIRNDLSFIASSIECLFVELTKPISHKFMIGCIYRPPNTDPVLVESFNSEFLKMLTIIEQSKVKTVFLAGDYNLHLLKHASHKPTADFLNTLLSFSFFPTIKYPTRVADQSSTLIDNIFLKNSGYSFDSAIVYNDISDHFPVVIRLKSNIDRKATIAPFKKREYSNANMERFNEALYAENRFSTVFDLCDNIKDPNAAYNWFHEIYKELLDKHFPLKFSTFFRKSL